MSAECCNLQSAICNLQSLKGATMNRRIHRIATALLALTLIVTALPARALPPGLAGLGAGAGVAEAAGELLSLDYNWLPSRFYTSSLAWGDVDNDGDLDLAVGNNGAGGNALYINDNGTIPSTYAWISPIQNTTSLAWGDVDNDGDLDLAVGNNFAIGNNNDQPNQLYRNCTIDLDSRCTPGGPILQDSGWEPETNYTTSMAWGDVDGDGDLDLAVGNNGRPNQLYRNCTITKAGDGCTTGGPVLQDTNWTTNTNSTKSVAWGDVDHDGDLDLAIGNYGANQLYRNCTIDLDSRCTPGAPLLQDSGWEPDANYTNSVAWGDVDNDGDLDLAVGNAWLVYAPISRPILVEYRANQLYRYNNGTLELDTTWKPADSATTSLAWGDVDGDGDLDLAVGNSRYSPYADTIRNQIYINEGDRLIPSTSWPPPDDPNTIDNSNTTSVAWGDVDGDGDLDLAVGNHADQSSIVNQLYRNQSGTFRATPDTVAGSSQSIRSAAWGDVDGDGDLDLAVGNDGQPNQIYRNDKGALTLAWTDPVTDTSTYSVAWGDVDGDGDLDLAVGNNNNQANQLYRNCTIDIDSHCTLGDPILKDSGWAPPVNKSRSVAWGDVDSDGALDLAVGNDSGLNQLYRNDNGLLKLDEIRNHPAHNYAWCSVWGDVDGDGDLDLVVCNQGGITSWFFRNQNGSLALDTSWYSVGPITYSFAWGDVDGDGDLDLAVGNYDRPNQLYRNNKGALALDTTWVPPTQQTRSVAWGDADGDGDLDLAVGNYNAPNQLYRNEQGTLILDATWSPAAQPTTSVAWGDVDNDGALDLLVINQGGPSQLYRHTAPATRMPNNPPSIVVTRPGADLPSGTDNANFFSAGRIISSAQVVSIPYTLIDNESDPASVRAEYSLDGGGRWLPAIAADEASTQNLTTSPEGFSHTFGWDIVASGVAGQSDNVVVRMVVMPANPMPGPYLYTPKAATTFPFRLRGNIARVVESVDDKNQPVAGAQVYHLPSGAVQGAAQLDNWLTGEPLMSNQLGYVNSRTPLNPGDRLAALRVISDTEKFTLYHTSPIDISSGLPDYQITSTGVQTLTVSPARPLIAFKLDVSLEWDARNDDAFLLQLRRDLQRAAELLYDWTDGQATLGAITIYHDKDHWEDVKDPVTGEVTYGADIQIYASNRLRPNSSQGGIVTRTISETVTIADTPHTLVYEPGALRMPATWNRNGDPGGTLGEDWPRTLAHELGHFALFLDDNYIGLDANNNLISVESCPGAMSDPYRDDWSEFQTDGAAWQTGGGCAQTLSARTAGRSDWATIKTFYDNDGLNFNLNAPTSFNANSGPDNLALALTQISDTGAGQASNAREAYVTLRDEQGKPYQPGAAARAVLYQGAGNGTRAIDMGAPTADLLLVRGARPGDTLCVYERLKQLVGCTTMSVATTRLTMRTLSSWQPDIQITPVTSTTVALSVPETGIGALAAGETLAARLFPDEGQAITVSLTLAGGAYTGAGIFATPPFDALVRVCVADGAGLCLADGAREAVADYSLGGEPAPRRRKKGRRRRRAPALSADGQAILFTDDITFSLGQFYAFQTIDQLPTPPAWATPVGFGYRLSASDDTLRGQIGNTSLSLGYFPTDVPAGTEEGITLYYLPAGGSVWQLLPTTLSLEDNTASAKARGEGTYALMASVPLALNPGWNLVYRYPGATQALPAALAGVSYATPITTTSAYTYTLVYGYDEGDLDDPWKLYAPGLTAPWGGIVNDLSELQSGDGYWIRSSAEITVPLRPSLDASDGILSAPPATYYGLAPVGSSGALSVEAWVGEDNVCGSTTTQPLTVNGQPGQGFSLNVLANGGGDALGCGYPGAPVRLVFSDSAGELGSYDATWDNTYLIPLGLSQTRIYLPLVARQPQPVPDLQIIDVRIVPAPPDSGEDYAIEVTVRNSGSAPVDAPFWVDLYLDPDAAPQPGEGWPDVATFGASWRVYGLAAGATLTLSSLEPNDPADPGRNYTLLPALLAGEAYTLYAQADAYVPGGDSQGAIIESDEDNNIGGPYVRTAEAP
nr:FG-GAP-like repeat-containing protein [Oscillochloris sp. ZM17-4]